MAGILKSNIKAFKKTYPYVTAMIQKTKENEYGDTCFCLNGILYFEIDGKRYQLTSKNQEEEAKLLIRDIDLKKDNLLVVFGIGNLTFLKNVAELSSDDTRIAVFEPNTAVFQYIIKNSDLTGLIGSGKIVFFTGTLSSIAKYMQYFFDNWINLVLNIKVVSLPNYYLYSQYRLDCIEKISGVFRRQLANLGNSLEDTMIGIDNQYINVDYCMLSNSINEIKGKYEGYPAIIVSAGPSLDKNIHKLKDAQGKALILACDASYRSCVLNGVKPDMIASIERGMATYQYYYENQEFDKDLVLIGPSVLRPEIFKAVPGKKIIMAKSAIGVEGWWKNQFDTVEYADMGHSCATAAFAVAQTAGCSPIILIGQDLAYTDDKVHGDLAHTKYEGANKRDDSVKEVWTKDIYGKPIRTSDTYNTFRYYFENKAAVEGIKLVDATEGGAYIDGSKIMDFEEALNCYCTKSIPFALNDLLKNRRIDRGYKIEKYRQIKNSVQTYIEELKQVQRKAAEYHGRIIHYKDFDFDSASKGELIEVIEIMSKNNQMLNYLYTEHTNLLNYYMQNIRQTIINVKNLGNEITGKNVRRNWELQINLIEMIDLASSVVINEFIKIGEFMDNKEAEEKKYV